MLRRYALLLVAIAALPSTWAFAQCDATPAMRLRRAPRVPAKRSRHSVADGAARSVLLLPDQFTLPRIADHQHLRRQDQPATRRCRLAMAGRCRRTHGVVRAPWGVQPFQLRDLRHRAPRHQTTGGTPLPNGRAHRGDQMGLPNLDIRRRPAVRQHRRLPEHLAGRGPGRAQGSGRSRRQRREGLARCAAKPLRLRW